ncbi:MAG: hypothetical protein LBR53_11970 [Deltaproteobacteria bacterium]|jgi:hypothetical protein|nr:hypothetical protein [Deltaproteobacteria bacterium]
MTERESARVAEKYDFNPENYGSCDRKGLGLGTIGDFFARYDESGRFEAVLPVEGAFGDASLINELNSNAPKSRVVFFGYFNPKEEVLAASGGPVERAELLGGMESSELVVYYRPEMMVKDASSEIFCREGAALIRMTITDGGAHAPGG